MTAMAAVLMAAAAGWLLPRRRDDRLRWLRTPLRASASKEMRSASGLFTSWVSRLPWVSQRAAQRRRAEVVELCQALSCELQAGAVPRVALSSAADGLEELQLLVSLGASSYGDVTAVLGELAKRPGASGLAALAACWKVCERTGAGLSTAAARLADALRDDEQVRREVRAQLAGPRATAVLLALLPLFGLAMGSAIGARPIDFLLQTTFGHTLLTSAVALEALGVIWTARIARQALPP